MFQTFDTAFSAFDLDGDGTITVAELAAMTRALGKPVSEEVLLRLVAEFDENRNGTIDFDEWCDLLTRQPPESAAEAEALESVRAVARQTVLEQRWMGPKRRMPGWWQWGNDVFGLHGVAVGLQGHQAQHCHHCQHEHAR